MANKYQMNDANRLHNVQFQEPITKNGHIDFKFVKSILLKNAGDSVITLNGKWTLQPNETFAFGLQDSYDLVSGSFLVRFGESGSNNRLEIAEFHYTEGKSAGSC